MTEFEFHRQVADYLSWAAKDALYTHLPMGEHRHKAVAARLKIMGTARGWADFLFVLEGGKTAALELKRASPKTYQSKEQKQFQADLEAKGGVYRVCRTLDEVESTLRAWGVVRGKAA